MLISQICERDEESLKSSEIINININLGINKVYPIQKQIRDQGFQENTVTSWDSFSIMI